MADETTQTTPAPEVLETAAVAPGPETTAAPAPEPSPESATEQAAAEKLLKESEVEEIIQKRLARARRSWEREAAQQSRPAPAAPTGELTREQFDSDEAFVDAKAEQRAHQLTLQREAETERNRIQSAFAEREEAAREQFEDYDAIVMNERLPISEAMYAIAMQSDIGPQVLYHLGQNPEEAARISKLNPFLQAKEMGRLEAKVAAAPPTRKTSSAPAPISPIRTPASKPKVLDPTDPRSTESMTTSEWIAERNRQELARMGGTTH